MVRVPGVGPSGAAGAAPGGGTTRRLRAPLLAARAALEKQAGLFGFLTVFRGIAHLKIGFPRTAGALCSTGLQCRSGAEQRRSWRGRAGVTLARALQPQRLEANVAAYVPLRLFRPQFTPL